METKIKKGFSEKEIKDFIQLLFKKKFVVKDSELEYESEIDKSEKLENNIFKLAKEIFDDCITVEEYQISLYILGSILIQDKTFILLPLREIAVANNLSIEIVKEYIEMGKEKNRFFILEKNESNWYFFLPTEDNKKLLEKFKNEI